MPHNPDFLAGQLPLAAGSCQLKGLVMSETQAETQATSAPPPSSSGQGPYIAPVPAPSQLQDVDPAETQEWLDSLEYVLNTKGPERVKQLMALLDARDRKSVV